MDSEYGEFRTAEEVEAATAIVHRAGFSQAEAVVTRGNVCCVRIDNGYFRSWSHLARYLATRRPKE